MLTIQHAADAKIVGPLIDSQILRGSSSDDAVLLGSILSDTTGSSPASRDPFWTLFEDLDTSYPVHCRIGESKESEASLQDNSSM